MIDWIHHDSVTTANPPLPFEQYLKSVKKPQTHADRIRAMTDEELAEWIVMVEQRIIEVNPMLERPALYADWLEWLKEEGES